MNLVRFGIFGAWLVCAANVAAYTFDAFKHTL
jgi:hypothetical protein